MRQQKRLLILFLSTAVMGGLAHGQTTPRQVGAVLDAAIQTPDVVAFQLRQYLMRRAPKLPAPASPDQWTAESRRLRKHLLDNVVFHGWPREWVNARPKFEDLGIIEAGKGYRMRKLRYEIVPGFYSTAILYEPESLPVGAGLAPPARGAASSAPTMKVPAILNVNGHVGAPGKAVEYKQKRCINYARRGMLALNLEWLAMGELDQQENRHWFGAHLDLAGANALGLFYLAMRKGLDYLDQHPNADRSRLGVTGLSGGGWQTIVLSAMDERVAAAIPVAGYCALASRIERPQDTGDIEQNATDFTVGQDYPHLTAMRAPRPTLLVYNAEDNCCFRAALVKPYIFDYVRPFFRLFGREDAFAWHENTDPADHNYQFDNRLQSYRFFSKHFRLPAIEHEIPVDAEIKSYQELAVGLPKDNLTILGLARKLAGEIRREPAPPNGSARAAWTAVEREKLKKVVRLQPVTVQHPWGVSNTKNKGLETRSYRFELSNGLSATGVWLKAIASPASAPATIVLHDKGKKAMQAEVSDRVNRGEQVLALDLLFHGDCMPAPNAVGFTQMLATTGDRPLGIQAAQLAAIARWLKESSGAPQVRLESTGFRNQVAALVAAALEPQLLSEVVIREGMPSLKHLLDAPVTYQDAPMLFCLDLLKEFDLDRLAALAEKTEIRGLR